MSQDNININVQETNDIVNIVSSEVTEVIDINVAETTEQVTLNITEDIVQVNINRVSTSVTQDLQSVTDFGNETTNEVIVNNLGVSSFLGVGEIGVKTDAAEGLIKTTNLNSALTLEFPDKTGTKTIATIDDIPTATSDLTNDSNFVSDASYVHTDNNYTTTEKNKLSGIAAGAEVNVNADWNATSGDAQILNKPTIPDVSGFATTTYVDTQDALKVDKVAGSRLITSAEATILGNTSGVNTGDQDLSGKVDKVTGYSLTKNDFTDTLKSKLDGIAAGAEVNVNSDWNATTGDALILNKPTIPSISGLATVTYVDAQDDLKEDYLSVPAADGYVLSSTTSGVRSWIAQSGGGGGGDMLKSTYDVDNTGIVDNAEAIKVIGRNATGSTLYKGTIIYISGSTGNRPNFVKARANGEATSAGTFGVIADDLANNADGYALCLGYLDNLDTRTTATHPFTADTLADGDTIYLSPTTAGYITNVKPSAPNHLVYLGKVTQTSPTNGTIVYRIQNGYELEELHNVAISSIADKQLLSYDSATSLWKNKSVTTSDIADSTNKRYVTDADLTTIGNQSGTNTGDETATTIKSKLGITTLSGSNTGDQDLSGLVPNTRTINTKPLSSNITLTTADIADSTDKRYVTDANLTTIANQSGTNTGDNAVNSLYSGLASSKQDTLVSGINIKTINGNSVLGSGNLTISGGILGLHALLPLSSGNQTSSSMQSMTGGTGQVFTANRLLAYPFIPAQSFTSSNLQINVSALAVGSLGKIAVYNDLNGVPDTSIFISSDLDLSTTGIKTATTSISFVAGTTYWLAFHGNATISTLNSLTAPQMLPLRTINVNTAANYLYRNATYTSGTPTTFGAVTYAAGNIPLIYITKA